MRWRGFVACRLPPFSTPPLLEREVEGFRYPLPPFAIRHHPSLPTTPSATAPLSGREVEDLRAHLGVLFDTTTSHPQDAEALFRLYLIKIYFIL